MKNLVTNKKCLKTRSGVTALSLSPQGSSWRSSSPRCAVLTNTASDFAEGRNLSSCWMFPLNKIMQRTFSREVGGECVEYEAAFGFSLSVKFLDTARMVDEAFGITQELLEAAQGGYVRVDPWNGHSAFANPVADILYFNGRWCLCARGARVRDLSTASDAPLVIARSAKTGELHSEIFAAERLVSTRQVEDPGQVLATRISWVPTPGVLVPDVRNIAKGLGPLTTNPFFPPPGLFLEARELPCTRRGRGFTDASDGGGVRGMAVSPVREGDGYRRSRRRR